MIKFGILDYNRSQLILDVGELHPTFRFDSRLEVAEIHSSCNIKEVFNVTEETYIRRNDENLNLYTVDMQLGEVLFKSVEVVDKYSGKEVVDFILPTRMFYDGTVLWNYEVGNVIVTLHHKTYVYKNHKFVSEDIPNALTPDEEKLFEMAPTTWKNKMSPHEVVRKMLANAAK